MINKKENKVENSQGGSYLTMLAKRREASI